MPKSLIQWCVAVALYWIMTCWCVLCREVLDQTKSVSFSWTHAVKRTHFISVYAHHLIYMIPIVSQVLKQHKQHIYMFYAFSRRFYPKRPTVHSGYTFSFVSTHVFPGNRTHNLCAANAMLYHWATGTQKIKHNSFLVNNYYVHYIKKRPKMAQNLIWTLDEWLWYF